jgi:MFS family permease
VNRDLRRRLRPLYATVFLQHYGVWYAIEKLRESAIGMTPAAITGATCVYIAVFTLGCIPAGYFADRWSRKGILAVGGVLMMGASAVCGLAEGWWVYTAGLGLWGLFLACYLGTPDSGVYDTVLEACGSDELYQRCYGRVNQARMTSMLAGAATTTAAVHVMSLRTAYFVTVPVTALSLVTLWLWREPTLHKHGEMTRPGLHLAKMRAALTTGPPMTAVAVVLLSCTAGWLILTEFLQLWWLGRVGTGWFGPLFMLLFGGAALVSGVAGKVPARRLGLLAAATFAVSLALASAYPLLVIAAQAGMLTGTTLIPVLGSKLLHGAVGDSSIRSGVSSTVEVLGYAAFIPAGLLFGMVAGHSIQLASLLPAGCLAVTAVAALALRRATVPAAAGSEAGA